MSSLWNWVCTCGWDCDWNGNFMLVMTSLASIFYCLLSRLFFGTFLPGLTCLPFLACPFLALNTESEYGVFLLFFAHGASMHTLCMWALAFQNRARPQHLSLRQHLGIYTCCAYHIPLLCACCLLVFAHLTMPFFISALSTGLLTTSAILSILWRTAAMRTPHTPYTVEVCICTAGAVFFIFLLLSSAPLLLTSYALPRRWRAPFNSFCTRYAVRLSFICTPFIRVHYPSYKNHNPHLNRVLICNHASMIDILFPLMLPGIRALLAKKWIFSIPLLSTAARCLGTYSETFLYSDRPDVSRTQQQNFLNERTQLCVFPEGRRSETGRIEKFHQGVFLFAQEHKLPLSCLVIAGTDNCIARHTWTLRPAVISFVVSPLSPQYVGESNRQFSQRCRTSMQQLLAEQLGDIYAHTRMRKQRRQTAIGLPYAMRGSSSTYWDAQFSTYLKHHAAHLRTKQRVLFIGGAHPAPEIGCLLRQWQKDIHITAVCTDTHQQRIMRHRLLVDSQDVLYTRYQDIPTDSFDIIIHTDSQYKLDVINCSLLFTCQHISRDQGAIQWTAYANDAHHNMLQKI